jgi:hypothetical protein
VQALSPALYEGVFRTFFRKHGLTGCGHPNLPKANISNSVDKGAEISAAKLKRAEQNLVGPGKSGGQTITRFIKKGPKRGQTFFRSGFS